MVLGSVVGIPTRCELDGPGIEFWWELDLSNPSRLAEGPIQPPVQWVLGNCPGAVKASGAWRWLPTRHLALRLKKEHRYTYSPPLSFRGRF